MIHSRKFLRSGTVVGSFKIDLKTVYDTIGNNCQSNLFILYFRCDFNCFCPLSLLKFVRHILCIVSNSICAKDYINVYYTLVTFLFFLNCNTFLLLLIFYYVFVKSLLWWTCSLFCFPCTIIWDYINSWKWNI